MTSGTTVSLKHTTFYGADIFINASIIEGEKATWDYPGHEAYVEFESVRWRNREIDTGNLKQKHLSMLEHLVFSADYNRSQQDYE